MDHFELVSEFAPTGDQPQAIEKLVKGFKEGNQFETLLGVTGSGKTFTMANVIQQLNKPTLILAHNKTLAAQLYSEFKAFFPHNAVEYFVSYYDYYQPEAYVPSTDTYIEKDSSINDEIDKLRHSATAALIERKDVIVVSSVSCIYGIGSKKDYAEMMISLRPGMEIDRDEVVRRLIDIQYVRNELDFKRGTFRVRGDVLEILPVSTFEDAIRVEFFGDEIDRIVQVDILTGEIKASLNFAAIFPASHYVVPQEQIEKAVVSIKEELEERVAWFKEHDQLLEAQRIAERTNFDIEMLKETGFCSGIENYSRHLTGLAPGQAPYTLIDFFGDDFLMIVDESHITVPQVTGDDTPASLSSVMLTDLLRGELGYQGLIVTDSLAMQAITDVYTPGQAAVKALQAGADLLLMPNGLADAYTAVLEAVQDGTIPQQRLDESVQRILQCKYQYGILTQ